MSREKIIADILLKDDSRDRASREFLEQLDDSDLREYHGVVKKWHAAFHPQTQNKIMKMTLDQIKVLAFDFAGDLRGLQSTASDKQADLDKIEKRYVAPLNACIVRARASRDRLRKAIEDNRELFAKPRTHEHHGVEFGIRKLKGKIVIEDAEKTVEKIKSIFQCSAPDYIRTIEEPDKKALEKLPATDLKKLGVSVLQDTDAVVVKAVDGEAEKQTAELLKEAK